MKEALARKQQSDIWMRRQLLETVDQVRNAYQAAYPWIQPFRNKTMLKTIHVEIDPTGHIHVLEPIPFKIEGKALLTLLESDTNERNAMQHQPK